MMISGFFENNMSSLSRQAQANSLRSAGRQLSSAEGERETKPTKLYDELTGQYHYVGQSDSAQLCGTGLDIGGGGAGAAQQAAASGRFYHGERPSDVHAAEREEFYEKEALRDMKYRRELFQQQRMQQQVQQDHSSSLRRQIDDVKRSMRGGGGPVVVPPAPPKPWEQGTLAPVVRRPARRQVESFSANASQVDLKVGDAVSAAEASAAAPEAQARAAAAREKAEATRREAAQKIGLAHGGASVMHMASQSKQQAAARTQRSRVFGGAEQGAPPANSGRARGGCAPSSGGLRSIIPDHGDSGIRMNVSASFDPRAIDNQMGGMASHTHVAREVGSRVSAPPGGHTAMGAYVRPDETAQGHAQEQYVPARKQIEEHPNTAVRCNDIGGYGAPTDDPLDADIGRSCSVAAQTARRQTARGAGGAGTQSGTGFVGGDMWHSGTDLPAGELCANNPQARPAGRFEGGFQRKVLPAGNSTLSVENKNLSGEGEGDAIGSDMRGNRRIVGPRVVNQPQAHAASMAEEASARGFEAAVEAEARRRMLSAQDEGGAAASATSSGGYVRAVGGCAATGRNALAEVGNAVQVSAAAVATAAAQGAPTRQANQRTSRVTAGSFCLSDFGGV